MTNHSGCVQCKNDLSVKFKVECWDKDFKKDDDLIGWARVSVNDLLSKETIALCDAPGGNTAKPGSLMVDESCMEGGGASAAAPHAASRTSCLRCGGIPGDLCSLDQRLNAQLGKGKRLGQEITALKTQVRPCSE